MTVYNVTQFHSQEISGSLYRTFFIRSKSPFSARKERSSSNLYDFIWFILVVDPWSLQIFNQHCRWLLSGIVEAGICWRVLLNSQWYASHSEWSATSSPLSSGSEHRRHQCFPATHLRPGSMGSDATRRLGTIPRMLTAVLSVSSILYASCCLWT